MKKKELVSFLDAVGLALDHVSEVKTIDKSTGEPHDSCGITAEEICAMKTVIACLSGFVEIGETYDPVKFVAKLVQVHTIGKLMAAGLMDDEPEDAADPADPATESEGDAE